MATKSQYAKSHQEKLADPEHYLNQAYTFTPELQKAILDNVPPRGRILEVGCGGGHAAAKLASFGYNVTAVDFSSVAVSLAKKNYGQTVKFALGDACHLNFPASYFDAVISVELVEHLQNVDQHLKEVQKVLKPGGCYIFKTPNLIFHNLYYWRDGKIKLFHPSVMSTKEVKKLLHKHNFSVVFVKHKTLPAYQRQKLGKFKLLRPFIPFAKWFPLYLVPAYLQPSIICVAKKQ